MGPKGPQSSMARSGIDARFEINGISVCSTLVQFWVPALPQTKLKCCWVELTLVQGGGEGKHLREAHQIVCDNTLGHELSTQHMYRDVCASGQS